MKGIFKQRGIDIREQINQGFVNSELGSAADSKACAVYDAAEINPTLLLRHASSAAENYWAAISCFLRAIPSIYDVRSKRLLKENVLKLLLRLEGMRNLIREAERLLSLRNGVIKLSPDEKIVYIPASFDPANVRDELEDDLLVGFDELLHLEEDNEDSLDLSSLFPIGTDVEVRSKDDPESWLPGKVAGYDHMDYIVKYNDGTEEKPVESSRVRLLVKEVSPSASFDFQSHKERMEVMSEIIESEREYFYNLSCLQKYYVEVLTNPAHWGGQKTKEETLFSQRTLSDVEAAEIFANIDQIVKLHKEFLGEMEEIFKSIESDQSLAPVFAKYAQKFMVYMDYVVGYENAVSKIEKFNRERMGFAAAEEAAKRHKVPPMLVLMKYLADRINTSTEQLTRLQERTPPDHPTINDMNNALLHFRSVKSSIEQGLSMNARRQECEVIGNRFSPRIHLATKTRFFVYQGKLNRMEKGNLKTRLFILFDDILICARKSEWLDRRHLRHKGTLTLHTYGHDAEFGPAAFYVKGTHGERWNMVCSTPKLYQVWMEKFSMCTNILCVNKGETSGNINTSVDSIPPPPPRKKSDVSSPELPPGWVCLVDENSSRPYYYNRAEGKTQWELPTV